MKNEPHLIYPTFNDQIHIVLQYIDIFQRMLHINKKQSDLFFEKSTFYLKSWLVKMTTIRDLWLLGGGGVSITRFSPIYFAAVISPR